MRFLSRGFLWLVLPWLLGCHNPARQNVPQVGIEEREAEWRKELIPGRRADRALGYLLTQGFEVRVTRDEKANVERILAWQKDTLRDSTGAGRQCRIDLAIEDETVQTVKIENGR